MAGGGRVCFFLEVGGETGEGFGSGVAGARRTDFQIDVADVGKGSLDGVLDARDGGFDGVGGEVLAELDVHGEEDGVGAEVHGEGIGDCLDVRVGGGEGADGVEGAAVCAFADEEAFTFDDKQGGDDEEDDADDDGSDAVCVGVAEAMAKEDADEGGEQAEKGGGVFKQDGKDAGVFALVDGAEDGLVAGGGAELADADKEGVALEEKSDGEDGVGPGGVFGRSGVADVTDAFGDGDATAEDEDEKSDKERPEIKFFAVTEGMGFVGGLAALFFAEEQKGPVAAIDDGVDGFREHGGRASEDEADDLGEGDGDVGSDGDEDGFAGGGHG